MNSDLRLADLPHSDSDWLCMICQRPIPDYVPEYCCVGLSNDCYCLGYPIYPPVCSDVCNKAMMDGIGTPMDERRIVAGIKLWADK